MQAGVVGLVVGQGLGWMACASAGSGSPAEVTRAQIVRLAAGDEGLAGELLTPEARRKAPLWPALGELPNPTSVVEVERTAVWQGERELELVRLPSGGAIRRGALALFRADSAEGVLAAFGRALQALDFARVYALMPGESRRLHQPGELEAVLRAREPAWRALGEAIADGRVVWGARAAERAEAVVTVGEALSGGRSDRRLALLREADGWKVFDVQPWDEYIAP